MTSDRTAVQLLEGVRDGDRRALARLITTVENDTAAAGEIANLIGADMEDGLVLGITGPPGAGKSTLVGRLAASCVQEGQRPAVLAIDPTSPITGGAILGDRIRMSREPGLDIYIRSLASRGHPGGIAAIVPLAIRIVQVWGADVVFVETVGVGQGEMAIAGFVDVVLLVTGPGTGDEIQAAKAGLLEIADVVVVNKADLPGSGSAISALRSTLEIYSAQPPPVLAASASEGNGIEDLLGALHSAAKRDDVARLSRRTEAIALAVAEAVRSGISSGSVTAGGLVAEVSSGNEPVTRLIEHVLDGLGRGEGRTS